MSIESNRNGYLFCRAELPGEKIFLSNDTSRRDLTFLKSNSLRRKRFQSSYCAKVGARPKKNLRGGGGRKVIPTLTTFSANSAGRLAPQARIPITSYWTSQIGLFLCWIRQKLKFTMLSQPFATFFFHQSTVDLWKRR